VKSSVRFVKQYTMRASGSVFMRFETSDDRRIEINVREGRDGCVKFTRREARFEAMRRLGITVPCPNGCADPVVPGVWIDPAYCAKRQATKTPKSVARIPQDAEAKEGTVR
jgi:hypothetical protein